MLLTHFIQDNTSKQCFDISKNIFINTCTWNAGILDISLKMVHYEYDPAIKFVEFGEFVYLKLGFNEQRWSHPSIWWTDSPNIDYYIKHAQYESWNK